MSIPIMSKRIIGSLLLSFVFASSLRAAEKPAPAKTASSVGNGQMAGIKSLQTGDAMMLTDQAADALREFQNAALQGNAEAAARLGNLLLFGRKSFKTTQTVTANPPEGIRWTFRAATNQVASACTDLAKAFARGIGVKTNLVEAYAWMRLSRSFEPGLGVEELDQLVLQLDAPQVNEAQRLAESYRQGHWPVCPVRRLVNGDSRLSLNGVTIGGRQPTAVINHQTFVLGEAGTVRSRDGELKILCAQIGGNSVTVEVEGEAEAHLLLMQ